MVLSSFLLIGISLYFFVPIRSQLTPAINWGRPDSLANLFTYMTRSTQPASVAASFGIPYLNRFWFTLSFPVIQFGLPVFWLAVLGAFALFKRFKRFFIFTFLVFVFNLSTATWAAEFSLRNYDLLGYLLPSLSVFTIWFAVGISLFTEGMLKAVRVLSSGNIRGRQKEASARLSHNQKPAAVRAVLCGLILLSPVFQIDRNFDECDKSSYDQAFEYADQILDSVKDNALIVVGDDNTLTTLWYLNYAAGKRPDVKIVSASGLTQRGYRDQLRDQYKQVHLPDMGSDNRARMGYQLCQSNIAEMPVYCQYYAKDKIFVQHLSPAGYLFEYHPEPVALSESHVAKQRAFLESNLKGESFDVITREHFGNLIFNLGVFYNHVGIPATSQEYFLWAVDIDPSNWRIYAQLGRAFLKLGLMDRAREFFQAALELDPYNQDVRRVLKDIQGKG